MNPETVRMMRAAMMGLACLVVAQGTAQAQEGRGPGGTPCGMPFDTGCLPGYHCSHDRVDGRGRRVYDSARCVKDGSDAASEAQSAPPAVPAPRPPLQSIQEDGLLWLPEGAVVLATVLVAAFLLSRKRGPGAGPPPT